MARETEYDVPSVNADNPAFEEEFEVTPPRAPMPAYYRGPSYFAEVDNLAEPQVLREDTILVSQRPSPPLSQLLFHVSLLTDTVTQNATAPVPIARQARHSVNTNAGFSPSGIFMP